MPRKFAEKREFLIEFRKKQSSWHARKANNTAECTKVRRKKYLKQIAKTGDTL